MELWSQKIFSAVFILYVISLVFYLFTVAKEGSGQRKLASLFALGGVLLHTVGLLFRWCEAGLVEIAAIEQVENRVLEGWEWFATLISHPPFTNMYESLVFFAWGIVVVYLVLEKKFGVRILGVFAIGLTIAGMGLASITPGGDITPLIPALQSWWLHLHVITASIAYAGFGVAAIASILYLVKDRVSIEPLGVGAAGFSAFMLSLGGGLKLFTHGEFRMGLMGWKDNSPVEVMFFPEGVSQALPFEVKVPFAGVFLLTAIALLCIAAVMYIFFLKGNKESMGRYAFWASCGGFVALGVFILSILVSIFTLKDIKIPAQMLSMLGPMGVKAPFHLSLSTNPYLFALFVIIWCIGGAFVLLKVKHGAATEKLPSREVLDRVSYRTILVAFPMMFLVIATGAIWAHYAWGRYWGWDPKETWSLITWCVYALYLHTRITHGWVGRRSAVISVVGFMAVIFTYIGVNMGLTGSGLHDYA